MRILFLTFVMCATISLVQGQKYLLYGIDQNEKVPRGLSPGMSAPDFKGINQFGDSIRLSDEWSKGKVVLIFYRGYWCGSCNKYLKHYQDSLQMIIDKGAQIIAITPEQNQGVDKTIDKTGASFNIISDHSNEIMKKYKVDFKVTGSYSILVRLFTPADIAKNNAQQEPYLPVPATYIIDKKGMIIFTQFDPNYKNRASVYQMLQHL